MNTKSKMAAVLAGIICLASLLGGCSGAQGPAQTKDFSLSEVSSIQADYDGESVTVKESDTDKITIVEYMDKTKKSYLAKIDLLGGVLTITEGARPIGNGVHSYIEIYLPGTYQNSLSIHTTDGRISSALALSLSSFHADTTNGALELSNLSADNISLASTGGNLSLKNSVSQTCAIDTTNADTHLDSVTGAITYESKGGDLIMNGASGSGDFQATGDGDMTLSFLQVSGDLSAFAKNGKIALTLPGDLNFAFSATTKDGNIQTPFSDALSSTGKTVGGTIGDRADVKIGLETKNGDIEVNVK